MKVKFLINANMTLTVLNLHQMILKVKVTTTSLKVKLRSDHDAAHLHPLTNASLPNINFLHLTVSEILPGQDFIGQGHYIKVKGQIKVRP